jgi:hypothetical protein
LDLQYSLQFCGVYKERFFLLQGAREGEALQKADESLVCAEA